jgi:hypothetical protein
LCHRLILDNGDVVLSYYGSIFLAGEKIILPHEIFYEMVTTLISNI